MFPRLSSYKYHKKPSWMRYLVLFVILCGAMQVQGMSYAAVCFDILP